MSQNGLIFGIPFGILLEKSGVSKPENIQKQMAFQDHTMLQTFLSASATSAIALSFLHLSGMSDKLRVANANWVGNMIGGCLVGVGMTLGGSCPGTVLAQIGSGRKVASLTIAGGIAGAFSYGTKKMGLFLIGLGIFHETIQKYIQFANIQASTVHESLGLKYWMIALPFAAAMFGVVHLVRKYLVKKNEAKHEAPKSFSDLMKMQSWNPVLSGIGIGLLQIPIHLASKAFLGTSSAFVALLGWLGASKAPYIQKAAKKSDSIFGILLDVGIVVGSWISTWWSGKREEVSVNWKTAITYFLSGFFLLFGSRLADGCTSGHGLSGMASQAISSYITVPAMFAGGMGLAYLLNRRKEEKQE